MIEIGAVLLHEDVVKENFVCNLNKCKGACCLEGDSGAPLDADELDILDEIYPKVKPFMNAKGIATIEKHAFGIVRLPFSQIRFSVDFGWVRRVTAIPFPPHYADFATKSGNVL